MQSQQKRVKWSRGETAEALEERTDTGITSASVEFMQDCIPDIYGNISRRPAIRPLQVSDSYAETVSPIMGFKYETIDIIPFYFSENDICLIGINNAAPEIIRIKDKKIVAKKTIGSEFYPNATKVTSYAQQNNYLVVATKERNYKIQFTDINGTNFNTTCEIWKFSAGWYEPNGTQTKKITNLNIQNLKFSGHREGYVYADPISGTSTAYSALKTGLTGNSATIEAEIPVGSIIQLPNIGAYMRVEGYFASGGSVMFPDVLFDYATAAPATYSDAQVAEIIPNGNVCVARSGLNGGYYQRWYNKVKGESFGPVGSGTIYRIKMNTSPVTEKESSMSLGRLGVWHFSGWQDTATSTQDIYVFGSLLTPIADENANDTSVNVEYEYTSLQPTDWGTGTIYPHPKKLVFNNQRLWAGAWAYSATDEYAITIGSQIARYNDFKNDYNQENEPITLDILTQFKEKILHLVDYNGLKIMTDSYEYAYENGAPVKQSANGSFEDCEPIVFDSLCLYIDSTGHQVKAMQYEFQNNVFNSNTINQLAPHDLVWNPIAMAAYEDKTHSTGKYLFVINEENTTNPKVAVCNFVPGNQANIWSRWTFPETNVAGYDVSRLYTVINTKNFPIFMIYTESTFKPSGEEEGVFKKLIVPAELDFDAIADYETTLINNQVVLNTYTTSGNKYNVVLGDADVDVFSNGKYQFTTTTTSKGYITDDVSELTNITVGFKIDSIIRSHPIDVGGKTKSIKKRIGKAQISVRETEAGAITINGKTGYSNPTKDHISFYGITGMKNEIKYTITNNNGAMFHLESLLMNIEYGTLSS